MTRSNSETTSLARDAIDESRRVLLDAIGPAPEMTLVRPFGNYGDELIWAGTRELLSGHVYREIGIDQLASASGELAVLSGGGAWSRRYNEMMPEALAIAELRFGRVIVLPSTFEVSEDRVRAALENSNATVFARERESLDRIRGLCRAQLAHDCAFFADISGYDEPGVGELNAFRTDDERLGTRELPPGNEDISETADSLETWLSTIAAHAVVNTDRAHVMIAAALMGKQVRYAPSSYFKVEAIAEYALTDFDVRPLAETAPLAVAEPSGRLGVVSSESPSRVTAAVFSRDQQESVVAAINSVIATSTDVQLLVLDRNSRPSTRAALSEVARRVPEIDLRLANRDSGVARSIRLATELAASEFVLFLDDQMRVAPGTIERLVKVLDEDPSASAVAPTVVSENGTILHCGGWPRVEAATLGFEMTLEGAAGPTGWVPSLGTLFRRSILTQLPFADGLELTCQNADWSLRAEKFAPGSLRRCPEARVETASVKPAPHGTSLVERARAARQLPSHSKFLEVHGRVLAEPLLELVPELRDRDGALNAQAAKLLLAIVDARGTDWTLMEWMNGGLERIFEEPPVKGAGPELSDTQRGKFAWLEAREERLVGIENGSWWQLREKIRKVTGR